MLDSFFEESRLLANTDKLSDIVVKLDNVASSVALKFLISSISWRISDIEHFELSCARSTKNIETAVLCCLFMWEKREGRKQKKYFFSPFTYAYIYNLNAFSLIFSCGENQKQHKRNE